MLLALGIGLENSGVSKREIEELMALGGDKNSRRKKFEQLTDGLNSKDFRRAYQIFDSVEPSNNTFWNAGTPSVGDYFKGLPVELYGDGFGGGGPSGLPKDPANWPSTLQRGGNTYVVPAIGVINNVSTNYEGRKVFFE